jgi:putative ATP-binding cassette transporter
VQVQLAISWLVDNFSRIAEWLASARRVVDLVEASEAAGAVVAAAPSHLRLDREGADVRIADLELTDENGTPVLACPSLVIPAGRHTWITGPASSGKSVLVRAMAGLWPWGSGDISVPPPDRVTVVPQRGYVPSRPLRDVLRYPARAPIPDAALISALTDTGLAHLVTRLDATERWDQALSFGERQRLAIARALLYAPDLVILDDALSSLEDGQREALEAMLRDRLPGATVISIGHPPPPTVIRPLHLVLARRDNGPPLLRESTDRRLDDNAGEQRRQPVTAGQ